MALLVLPTGPVRAAELKPATLAAFDRYVRVTEAAHDYDTMISVGPAALQELRHGSFVIERLHTLDSQKPIDVPDGLIHHWLGVVFVPGVTAAQAVALLQDYHRHADIYAPAIQRSKVLSHEGSGAAEKFVVDLRFYMKKVIAVVLNTQHEARFTRLASDRAYSVIRSTRIAEVENPGTPREREKPVGNDGGYLWRINSYWRFLERDGGTYIQCESISLTRGIPIGFGWLIGPFVTSIPKESLTFTLETTRRALERTKDKEQRTKNRTTN